MKRWLIYSISFIYIDIANCQTVVSSCSAPDSIVKIFRKSADKLATGRVEYIGDTYKDSIIINRAISKSYLKALLAVYNATILPARDTVMFFPIVLDKRVPHELNNLFIQADSSKQWMKNLRNSIIPCGDPTIDNILSKYYFTQTGYSDFSGVWPTHGVTFHTDSNFYIRRICDKIISLISQGVVYTSPGTLNLDGFDITDSINTNYLELKFKLGWGDCMAGCIYKRFWSFRVYNDCSVEYKGHYGDPLPYNVLANISEKTYNKASILIWPNPASDKLSFNFLNTQPATFNVSVLNSLGKEIIRKKVDKVSEELDVTELSNGVYIVRVNSGSHSSTRKLIISK